MATVGRGSVPARVNGRAPGPVTANRSVAGLSVPTRANRSTPGPLVLVRLMASEMPKSMWEGDRGSYE